MKARSSFRWRTVVAFQKNYRVSPTLADEITFRNKIPTDWSPAASAVDNRQFPFVFAGLWARALPSLIREERYPEQRFGEEYRRYKEKVANGFLGSLGRSRHRFQNWSLARQSMHRWLLRY